MTKKFKAFRFDPELYEKFKKLAQDNNLMITEALEKFMKACVEIGAPTFPEPASHKREVETEARVLLAWLCKGEFWYHLGNEEDEYSVEGRLLQLLPRIEDDALRNEIENRLKFKKR
jgi:hypothetical protein